LHYVEYSGILAEGPHIFVAAPNR